MNTFELAERAYRLFLAQFADDKQAYEMRFYRGELCGCCAAGRMPPSSTPRSSSRTRAASTPARRRTRRCWPGRTRWSAATSRRADAIRSALPPPRRWARPRRAASARRALYVVAAGNDGVNNDTSPHTPCNPATDPDAPNKICVAATDSSDALAGFSNFGAVNVDLAAPGVRHPQHRPDEDRLQRRLRDADRGPLDDQRRRPDRHAALGAHHAVLDQPHPQPHRLAGRDADTGATSQPGQLGAQHAPASTSPEAATARSPPRRRSTPRTTSTTSPSRPPAPPRSPRAGRRCSSSTEPAQGTVTADLPAAFNGQTGVFVRFRLDSDGVEPG